MRKVANKKRLFDYKDYFGLNKVVFNKTTLILGISFITYHTCFPQYLIHRTLNTSDGLPSDYVNHISQDMHGYIWISTDKGACRFDGKQFDKFTVDNGLSNNFITSTYKDNKGDIWFGSFSDRPLTRLAGDMPTHFQIQQKGVKELFFDSRNRTYLCDQNKFICLQQELSLPKTRDFNVQAVQLSKDSFLIQYPEKWILLDVSNKEPKISMTSKENDINGQMHIFNNTIFIVGNQITATINTQKPWPWKLEKIYDGNLYSTCSIITDSGIILGHYKGLFEFTWKDKKRIQINKKFNLPEIGINHLFRDKQGSLWIATHGKGIIICPKQPINITQYEGDRIVGIASNKKEIAVITVSGLFNWKPEFLYPLGKDMLYQHSGLYFCKGNWWLSDYQFLYGPVQKLKEIYSRPSFNNSNGISSFLIDNNNIEYIGTYADGIIRRKDGKIIDTLNSEKGLCSSTIEKVLAIPSGIAALSYSNGFNIIDKNDHISHFDKLNGLLSNTVYTVSEYKDTLLVGTEKGMTILVKGKKAGEVLLDPLITGQRVLYFFNDQSGRHFLLTDKCLCIREGVNIKPIRSQKILSREREIIKTGYYHSEENLLFVGTSRGLAYLPMQMVHPDTIVNEPKLYKVSVGEGDSLTMRQATIRGSENRISFSFTAQTFLIGLTPQIHVKLQGFDTAYRVLSDQYHITYQNLPPGKYSLLAFMTNGDGFQSAKRNLFQLNIQPNWWETSIFRILSLMMAASISAWGMWQISQKRYQNKLAILKLKEEQHLQRERIRRDLHDNIGSQLSYIATQLDWLEQNTQSFSREKITDDLKLLGENTRQIVTDLRESMWSLKFDLITVELLSQRIQKIVQKHHAQNRFPVLHFYEEAHAKMPISPHNALNLLRICQEALNNALKHANARKIEVSLTQPSIHVIRLRIADDGTGFDVNAKDTYEKYGMENMERRANESGILLKIESMMGSGTLITADSYLQ